MKEDRSSCWAIYRYHKRLPGRSMTYTRACAELRAIAEKGPCNGLHLVDIHDENAKRQLSLFPLEKGPKRR